MLNLCGIPNDGGEWKFNCDDLNCFLVVIEIGCLWPVFNTRLLCEGTLKSGEWKLVVSGTDYLVSVPQ